MVHGGERCFLDGWVYLLAIIEITNALIVILSSVNCSQMIYLSFGDDGAVNRQLLLFSSALKLESKSFCVARGCTFLVLCVPDGMYKRINTTSCS